MSGRGPPRVVARDPPARYELDSLPYSFMCEAGWSQMKSRISELQDEAGALAAILGEHAVYEDELRDQLDERDREPDRLANSGPMLAYYFGRTSPLFRSGTIRSTRFGGDLRIEGMYFANDVDLPGTDNGR